MQLYKIKLSDGYLENEGELYLYTRGEALKKAISFKGKIEKHGQNYAVVESTLAHLSRKQITPIVLSELQDRAEYVNTDTDMLSNEIYNGDVFDAILGEQMELLPSLRLSESVLDELYCLSVVCKSYTCIQLCD